MEHMSRGSLFHVLTKERRVRRAIRRLASPSMPNAHLLLSQLVSPSRFLFLMRDAWRGLAFLHEGPHVVHGDIKSLNLLIGACGWCVLSCGLSCMLECLCVCVCEWWSGGLIMLLICHRTGAQTTTGC